VSSWEEALAAIRAEFVRRGPAHLDRLERALDGLARPTADVTPLAALRLEFHRLAGTGGTYGLSRIGALALEGESRCAELIGGGRTPSVADVERWREILSALRAEFAAARAPEDAA
jgi:hypothetical protein